MTLLQRVDQVPPFLCYYLCRTGKSSSTHPGLAGIAEKSGLSESSVMRLSQAFSWKGVKLGTMEKFCDAIGVQFVRQTGCRYFLVRPFKRYLNFLADQHPQNPLKHLDVLQKRRFFKLCQKWSEQRWKS